jgi:hypothetical protein
MIRWRCPGRSWSTWPGSSERYPERRRTPYEHAEEIQERFKYRDFTDRRWGREFRGFLYGRAWTHAEGPVALFNHAVTWLRKNRVLLPGVSVLARRVSEARTAAERRLYEAVARAAHRADPALAPALAVPEGKWVSELERLRTPPVKSTGTAMVRAMERVEEISAFALGAAGVTTRRVHSPGRVPWMPGDLGRRPGRRHAAPLRPGGCWSWMP